MLIATLALALVVLLLVLLWTPIDLSLAAERERELRFCLRVSWLYGLVTKELEPRARERRHENGTPPPKSKSGGASRLPRMVRSKGFISGVARLLRRVLAGIEIRRAELRARAGFDDPADTGRFLAVLYPATRVLQSVAPLRIDFEPDFVQEVFSFHARSDLRIVPSRVIGPVLAFTFSRATLRAFVAARA